MVAPRELIEISAAVDEALFEAAGGPAAADARKFPAARTHG